MSRSPRTGLPAALLPEPVPSPRKSPNVRWNPISQLMRQHQDLPAVMRFVREHVGEHRSARWPHRSPASTRKLRHSPLRSSCQRVFQHAEALFCALAMRGCSLLHRALIRIERRWTLQMWRGILQPHEPAVVQMRENRGNRASIAARAGRFRSPGSRIKMLQQDLIHCIVD